MKYIEIVDLLIDNTRDCIKLLNSIDKSDWKRTSRFILNKGDIYNFSPESVVRVFFNGKEYVSLICYSDGIVVICRNIDLSTKKDTIRNIQKQFSKLYTHDYGEVFYNPWTNKLHIVCGDGGLTIINDNIEEVVDYSMLIDGVDDCEVADEWYPLIYEEEGHEENINECFIEIGSINIIDNNDDNETSLFFDSDYQIMLLREQLEMALANEEYEKCSILRDKIKKLEDEYTNKKVV